MNRGLSKGWRAWQSMIEALKAKRESMRKSLGHMLNRGLLRGFSAWLEIAIERAEFLQKLRKGLGRLVHCKLALGFGRWGAVFAPHDDYMSNAVHHFLNRELVRGWSAWQAIREELQAKRAALRKSLSHFLSRKLVLGWVGWLSMIDERAFDLDNLRRSAIFLFQRKLNRGILAWRGLVQDRHAALSSLRRSASRLLHSSLFRGLHSLKRLVADANVAAADRAILLARAGGHLIHRELSRGWLALCVMLEQRAEAKERLRISMVSMMYGELLRGMITWRSAIKSKGSIMSKSLRHMLHHELSRGWRAWQLFSREHASLMRQIRKGLSALFHQQIVKFFENLHAIQTSRHKLRKSFGHLVHRSKSRGFGAWSEMAVERAEFLQVLRKGLSRMINRKLLLGFDRWIAAFAPRDDPMSKALLYFVNREIARGWVCWYETWKVLKAKRESMRKSLGHLLHRGLSRGWGAWIEMLEERAAFLQLLSKGVRFMINRKL
eukprot:jgi/Chrpa1/24374/Chrysochromulina_OHIO_Genome00027597-RA